ncbi:hypothetical protein FRB90_012517 [Tulasnella sp. 427]|nr:hypothetical protein FRB90_012517 [Tulasnella sp. 427]
MAKVPSGQTAATFNGAGAVWFKAGQVTAVTNGGSSITFPTDNMPQYTFTVPSKMPNGDYLMRVEHIALHAASSFQGGSTSPSSYVSIPGVYNGREPGILINIYYPIPPTYTQPGPGVWS